jgi:hypothetical protein
MPYKPNYTDIRSFKIRDPLVIRTSGFTAGNGPADWRYLTTGTFTRGSDLFLVDGVFLQNIGPNGVVLSEQGVSAGTFLTGVTADGYLIAQNQTLDFKINNLADVIVKSTSATTTTGITLSYFAS